mmetsp:Transcript_5474/g.15854  ORF Transcript_5474/g.15854 Transcript_5474/m.15854 type:complete len:135 (-) Transcript_5474:101-505(-)
MSASTKIPPLHVLRGILRRLRLDPTKLSAANQQARQNGRGATTTYVLNRYRAAALESSKNDANNNNNNNNNNHHKTRELHKLAYEYMILRQDIDERRRLQIMDTGAENKLSPNEMSRRAAARAGLALPQLNPDL